MYPADLIFTVSHFNIPCDWLCICKSRTMWGYHSTVIQCFNRLITCSDEYKLHLNIYFLFLLKSMKIDSNIYINDFDAIGMHTFIVYSVILKVFTSP